MYEEVKPNSQPEIVEQSNDSNIIIPPKNIKNRSLKGNKKL